MREQREIKFRQWLGNRFNYWGIGVDSCTFVGPASGGGVNAQTAPQQQFTGLHDKNGKEIYEGDILATSNDGSDGCDEWDSEIMGVVEWDECSAGFVGVPERSEESIYDSRYVTVIGNIYENPELLG
jgi:hypothetical protein